jgi:hypothetical protein
MGFMPSTESTSPRAETVRLVSRDRAGSNAGFTTLLAGTRRSIVVTVGRLLLAPENAEHRYTADGVAEASLARSASAALTALQVCV